MSEPLSREEARAALEAYREVGDTHGDQVADAFIARIERRIDERLAAKPSRRSAATDSGAVVLGICSLIFAIPLIAIASESGGLAIVAVAALLITINALYHQRTK